MNKTRKYRISTGVVTHAIGLWLKKLGYNDDVPCWYLSNGALNYPVSNAYFEGLEQITNEFFREQGYSDGVCTAPTYLQAISWLARHCEELRGAIKFDAQYQYGKGVDLETWAEQEVTRFFNANNII